MAGIWFKVVLNKASRRARRLWDRAKEGVLKASRGAISHLIRKAGDTILYWPLAELSLIDTSLRGQIPAHPGAVAVPAKAYLKSLGAYNLAAENDIKGDARTRQFFDDLKDDKIRREAIAAGVPPTALFGARLVKPEDVKFAVEQWVGAEDYRPGIDMPEIHLPKMTIDNLPGAELVFERQGLHIPFRTHWELRGFFGDRYRDRRRKALKGLDKLSKGQREKAVRNYIEGNAIRKQYDAVLHQALALQALAAHWEEMAREILEWLERDITKKTKPPKRIREYIDKVHAEQFRRKKQLWTGGKEGIDQPFSGGMVPDEPEGEEMPKGYTGRWPPLSDSEKERAEELHKKTNGK